MHLLLELRNFRLIIKLNFLFLQYENQSYMKTLRIITALFFIGVFVPVAQAQDAVKMAGSVYQNLMDNDRVRLLKVDLQPEERTVTHFHPDHLLYVLEGGKLAIQDTTGNAGVVDLAAGDYHWFKAGKHSIVNIGTTTIVAIVVELKEESALKPEE